MYEIYSLQNAQLLLTHLLYMCTKIPEWQTTNPALEAKLLASKLNKKKKKMSNKMDVEGRGRSRRR